MKPIVLTHSEWAVIFNHIKIDYSPSVALISWKRREKLGFHVRDHSQWVDNKNYQKELQEYEQRDRSSWLLEVPPPKGSTEHVICLDFYDESKRTMFLLKYGELIQSVHKWNKLK